MSLQSFTLLAFQLCHPLLHSPPVIPSPQSLDLQLYSSLALVLQLQPQLLSYIFSSFALSFMNFSQNSTHLQIYQILFCFIQWNSRKDQNASLMHQNHCRSQSRIHQSVLFILTDGRNSSFIAIKIISMDNKGDDFLSSIYRKIAYYTSLKIYCVPTVNVCQKIQCA